jgi:RNA polymerase sigma factor (sigma-70 family)
VNHSQPSPPVGEIPDYTVRVQRYTVRLADWGRLGWRERSGNGPGVVTILEASRSQLAAALARVAAGDRTALRMVYQDTSAKLFGVLLRILNDRGEAEDVLQDVYVTVWRKAASFDAAKASPITWLVTIARNRAIDRLRASGGRRRTEPIEAADDVRDPAPMAVEHLERKQEQHRLAHCLEELEARHAAAIRAAFLDGATYEELAQRMSVPLGTMKSWIRRGLQKLRACLEG